LPSMKSRSVALFFLLVAVATSASCANRALDAGDAAVADGGLSSLTCTAVAPTACTVEPPPRYGQIADLVRERCVPCHDGVDPEGPWPLTSYDDVADWHDVIRDEVVACRMPPVDGGVTISDEERQALLMWLRCGFLE
jgi:hypothetical protein